MPTNTISRLSENNNSLNSRLWVFGHSMCLPFDLNAGTLGWDQLLAQQLGTELKNLAQPASDNLYIYSQYQQHLKYIQPSDIVIVGWSHYSRKLFPIDLDNPKHKAASEVSKLYPTPEITFMRLVQKRRVNDLDKWRKMVPQQSGIDFYDTWFQDYYNKYEQQINLQSYLDSVQLTCPGLYVPFYFSKESTNGVRIDGSHGGYALEYVLENKVAISEDNLHFSEIGHQQWCQHLLACINNFVTQR